MPFISILVIVSGLSILFVLISFLFSMKRERNNYYKDMTIISDITCPTCQSSMVKKRLPITDSFWGSRIGPKYLMNKKKVGMNLLHCAPMHADICMKCGTVLRLYIDVPKQGDWIYGDNTFSKN